MVTVTPPILEGTSRLFSPDTRRRRGKTAWSYPQFLPLEAFRANAIEQPTLSATAYLAVETALLTEVNLPWYTAGLSRSRELPGPDPGVRARLDLGGGSARDAAREAISCRGRRRSRCPGAFAKGDDRGRLEPHLGRTIRRHGLHGHAGGPRTRTFYLCAARACGEESPALAAALRRIAKDEEPFTWPSIGTS